MLSFTQSNLEKMKAHILQTTGHELKYIIVPDFETYYSSKPQLYVENGEEKQIKYSLRYMTNEEYVLHPWFTTHTLAFSVLSADMNLEVLHPAQVITNEYNYRTPDSPEFDPLGARIAEFVRLFPWHESAIVCQNAKFDLSILAWRYGNVKPAMILDTLSMALALRGKSKRNSLAVLAEDYNLPVKKGGYLSQMDGVRIPDSYQLAKLCEYNEDDVKATTALFKILFAKIPFECLWNMHLIREMYTHPILLGDRHMLQGAIEENEDAKTQALMDLGLADTLEVRKYIRSADKFASILKVLDVEIPMKWSAKKQCEIPAFAKTDPGMQELLEHDDPKVAALASLKLDLASTNAVKRCERLRDTAKRWKHPNSEILGWLPMPIQPYGAHTGRGAGEDKINPQNFDKKGPLRAAIQAPPGCSLVAVDSGQNQARGAAWTAGCESMLEMFRRKDSGEIEDVYVWFGANFIFKCKENEITPEMRFISKGTVLGLQFGMGQTKFSKVNNTTSEIAKVAYDTYHFKFPEIKRVWYECEQAMQAIQLGKAYSFGPVLDVTGLKAFQVAPGVEGIILPNGMVMNYPDLRKEETGWSFKRDLTGRRGRLWGGIIFENIIQALEQVFMQHWRVELDKFPHWHRFALDLHDATVLVCQDQHAKELAAYAKKVMSTPPEWATDLPLDADAGLGKTLAEIHA